ncbi:ankyrin repeat-containing protein BDA1-like [Juglans microcarpa x Juglans regia]|uniref:ankyrin repeat-containing protein BDA1-like n=1 Tax=Juglans microcarpa x Juglans regia TaxID=2249226 RepID=UPI001B7EFCE6|nr:ankyrin repeat-containing protein BDA1-like [Juglans microcarpa x Juglans regia]
MGSFSLPKLAITPFGMDPSHSTILSDAAQHGNIPALYLAIKTNPEVLDKIDKIPFSETPLHTTASVGQTEFAMEIMMLKPSFARKLNQDGFTPMHLALQFKQTKLVLRLLDVDKDLVRVQGRGGVSPFHYAAEIGEEDLLVEFLNACPKSIEDVTNRKETALHIALKKKKFDAFRLLVGWLRRSWFIHSAWMEKNLLNWPDDDGNTPLHLAVSTNDAEVVRCFMNCISVDMNIKNSANQTALEILEQMHGANNYRETIKDMIHRPKIFLSLFQYLFPYPSLPGVAQLRTFLSSRFSISENYYIFMFRQNMEVSNDTRNMLLVVATLVVTVTYQAALSPPGGVWQDDFNAEAGTGASELLVSPPSHHAGRVIMSTKNSYLFFTLNTLTFFMTNMTIIFLLPLGKFTRFLVILPLCALTFCYCASTYIIFPTDSSRVINYLLLLPLASLVFLNYFLVGKLTNLIQPFHPIAQNLHPKFTRGWF